MSYRHTTVASIHEHHETLLAPPALPRAGGNDDMRTALSHMKQVEGIAIDKNLYNYVQEALKVYPHLKFGFTPNCDRVWSSGTSVMQEVWAYLPGDEYAIVKLGHRDYSLRNEGKLNYAVYSRAIKNEKYSDGRDQYHMAMSDKLDRAVKNLKKYFRPYRPEEITKLSVSVFASHISQASYSSMSALGSAERDVRHHYGFMREMRTLVETQYAFLDIDFAAKIKSMIVAEDAYKAKREQVIHGYHINIRTVHEQHVFDVTRIFDVRSDRQRKLEPVVVYTPDTLPEELAHKMAALSMLESGKFVEGLGLKVSDVSYWTVD